MTAGASQGGGLAIAVAHLASRDVTAALPEVPFLAHPRRALDVTDSRPYRELAEYCLVNPDPGRAGVRHPGALRCGQPRQARDGARAVLRRTGRRHHPLSTVFAAFHHYAGRKDIAVYPYNGHEGGGTRHFLAQLAFLRDAGLA